MKCTQFHLAVIASLALTGFVLAIPAQADNSQQSKMTSCNADAKAKSLSGDDRKQFMKTCLSAAPAATPVKNSQQAKMTSCNADAKTKGLTGDARKQFMSSCLKSS